VIRRLTVFGLIVLAVILAAAVVLLKLLSHYVGPY
jgi:hypothetical protein